MSVRESWLFDFFIRTVSGVKDTRLSLHASRLPYSDSEHLFLHRACRSAVLEKSLVSARQQRYITVTRFQKVSSVIPTRVNLQDHFVSQRVLMTDPTSAGVRPISSEQLTEIIQAMEIIHSCSWKPFQTQKHSFIWNKGIILLKRKSKNVFMSIDCFKCWAANKDFARVCEQNISWTMLGILMKLSLNHWM